MLKDKYTLKLSSGDALNLKCALDGLCEVHTIENIPPSRLSRSPQLLSHIVKVSLMKEFGIKLGKKMQESRAQFSISMKQPEALAFMALYMEKKIRYNTTTAQVATEIHQSI